MSEERSPFYVRGSDGADYPADYEALRVWAANGTLAPDQYVFDSRTDAWLTAAQLLGPAAFQAGGVHAAATSAPPARGRSKAVLAVLVIILLLAARVYIR